jgi:hypothetical protein
MADYPISNVPRRIVYTGSAGVGPYAFEFEVLENTDINVYKNDVLLTLTTDYTVAISPTLGSGSITLVSAATGTDRITIVGSRAIERTSDFTTGGDFFANTLNDEMDSQTILTQQVAETAERSIKAPVTDPTTINMTLPINTARAGKSLAFDADGNPVVGEPIGNFRGDWAAGVTYQIRDIVTDTSNDNVYYATQTHTSSGELPIDDNVDSNKWAIVIDAGAAGEARVAAEAAQAAAELAETNAETSATNAASSASAASSSASAAATSATNASNSATSAATSATNSSNSATAAATSASAASTSATNAATSATNAANSATSASTSASTATTQATNASNSATAAATSATNAANSASAASTSASNAATSATNAANSATAAATSETNAAASATSAADSYDAFDDRYLGSKSSAPTLDNDGNALLTGALYWNTSNNSLFVWDGTAWNQAAFDVSDSGVASFNTRTGVVTLTSTDVTDALTYTPASISSANTFTANQIISVTDNTNAALRITQAGTGNALLVEDEANPDSTPFVIKNDGKVGIGTASPSYELEVQAAEPTSRVYATNAALASMIQIANPSNAMMIGKDREGSSGWYGSAGEYVIAGNGNYPMNFWTNSVKTLTITANNQVHIGGVTNSGASVERFQIAGTTGPLSAYGQYRYSNDAFPAAFRMYKSKGTTLNSQGAVIDGDGIATVQTYASDGTSWKSVAAIGAVVDGTVSTGIVPAQLRFSVARPSDGVITTQGAFRANGDFQFNSGYGSAAVAYGCRAWVNFNGTGTVAIRASGNVSSITDNGTGNYTVNFTTAMPDANYSVGSVNAIVAGNIQLNYVTSYSASNYTVEVRNGFSGNFDSATIFLQAFR